MDEQGSISKSNLIKGALIISGLGITAKKVSATFDPAVTPIDASIIARLQAFNGDAEFGDGSTCSPNPHRPGMEGNIGPFCTPGGSEFDSNAGHTLTGESCNADVGLKDQAAESDDGTDIGEEHMTWFCGRKDCSWLCTTGDGTSGCTYTPLTNQYKGMGAGCDTTTNHNRHKNCGTLDYGGFGPPGYGGHGNKMTFEHVPADKGLRGTHEHISGHASYSELADCPQTVSHTNDCKHSSHCSHMSHKMCM